MYEDEQQDATHGTGQEQSGSPGSAASSNHPQPSAPGDHSHPMPGTPEFEHDDARADEWGDESFPSSDPPGSY